MTQGLNCLIVSLINLLSVFQLVVKMPKNNENIPRVQGDRLKCLALLDQQSKDKEFAIIYEKKSS